MNISTHRVMSTVTAPFSGWRNALACVCASGLLAACGGGGGSPGTNSNGVAPSKAASVVLIASAETIDSSGLDGTEVTLTAIVKDANSNALPGETVDFKADSGNISSTTRISNANGMVVEKLNVKGNPAVRVISITASAGGAVSAPVKVTVVAVPAPVPTLTLTTDKGVLDSSGAAGSEITVFALVKDSSNTVVPGVKVNLSVDSGSLSLTNRSTDAKGVVSEKLSTSGDPSSRVIRVSASVAGAKAVSTVVTVAGTRLSINAASTVNLGASTDVTVKLVDSAGNALNGQTVSFSSGLNTLAVKGGGAAVTNTAGQLTLSYSAASGSGDTITVKALGETAAVPIQISSSNFYVNVVDGAGTPQALAAINQCYAVAIHNDNGGVAQSGTVSVSASRGTVYADAGCASPLNAPLALVGGNATAFLSAANPGVATLTATANANATSVQGSVEFYAALPGSATISVQADPAVVGANTAGSTSQQATIRATVRDGTSQRNLVRFAQVAFSIISDPSGGSLTQPSLVTTGADGSASVSYIAGSSDTKLDGVLIRAQLQGASNASAIAALTVAKKSLFITAGTGNTIGVPNPATYQVDYSVFVTDAAGNPVPGVNITGSVRPRNYYKGSLYFEGTDGPWAYSSNPLLQPKACLNEDVDSDGQLSGGEDTNGNHALDPGIPITVSPASTTTDARGQATVSLLYPRDRANWLDVDLTIRGQVSGTEARYVGYIKLIGLSTDYSTHNITPPGRDSPYGTVLSCTSPN
ncbi:Ig-like domain-containing protein [Rugamonas sp. CCM 8940]|uniref:Ig-like domain-containing protein n=1 Tax=Rugamonas sp. CCM 8940 TaxID=2765359 RepID=UPI001F363620|nr:Ig-like domain-containing protein [Rugamonas sp. CCM 8940]